MRLSRQESQQLTQRRLRSAAALTFAQRGICASSVDGIAQAAGFSRGAFYSNYATKEELLLELMEEEQTHELNVWAALIKNAASFETLLPKLERRFDTLHNRNGRELLMMELQLEAARNKSFGEAYEASSRKVLALMADVIRTLAEMAGNPHVDVEATAVALRALSIGLAGKSSTGERSKSWGRIMTTFLRQALEYNPNKLNTD